MKHAALLFLAGMMLAGTASADTPENAAAKAPRWLVYYHDNIPAEKFKSYDVLVFDADFHAPLGPLMFQNKKLLGYLSIGEVAEDKPYYKALKEKGLLLGTNANWGGHYIDMRNPEWARMIIEELIPSLIKQGFNGVMLDTLDSATYLEQQDPVKYAGMKRAAADLVQAIRYQYPGLTIMANRGFELMPMIEDAIDMLLAESIYISYNFKDKTFARFPDSIYQEFLTRFRDLKGRYPKLQIFTLDYWDMKDAEGVKAIYRAHRANGLIPYVSSIDLQTIYEEPE